MDIVTYLRELWALSIAVLTLDTTALAAFVVEPKVGILALGLVLLAGISRLLGDSVVLFINHVPARRFVAALLGGALVFALELGFWALSSGLVATIIFNATQTLTLTWLLVAVACAPWLFGFLVFLPYVGLLVRWILRVWSWLILVALLQMAMSLSLTNAFIIATGGWLALRILELVLARRDNSFHDRFWTKLTGKPPELTFSEQSGALASELRNKAQYS